MNVSKKTGNIKKLTVSAVCLAFCMALPFLTGQIPQIGNVISPMHIPVLLCGFICGPYYAAAIGLIAPVLRFLMFGMPPLMPIGIAMCLELATYGLVSGVLYRVLLKKTVFIYVSLIAAMILGRFVWGIACFMLLGVSGMPFTWEMFVSGAFTLAIPGIIIHIALIPVIVMALRKTGSFMA